MQKKEVAPLQIDEKGRSPPKETKKRLALQASKREV
jgi:hypothetical protein